MNASRLSGWNSGDEGIVTAVDGCSPLADRLRELGVMPGGSIRMVQHGSPMLIQVGESRFCLRRSDAECISAEVRQLWVPHRAQAVTAIGAS